MSRVPSRSLGLAPRDRRARLARRASARDARSVPRARGCNRPRLHRTSSKEVVTMSLFTHLVLADSGLGGQPNPNGLPGSSALQQLISGLAFWALLASLAGLFVSAIVWALSAHSGNYHHASAGRRGTIISAVAAFLVGAAPAIVNFFENLGRTVH